MEGSMAENTKGQHILHETEIVVNNESSDTTEMEIEENMEQKIGENDKGSDVSEIRHEDMEQKIKENYKGSDTMDTTEMEIKEIMEQKISESGKGSDIIEIRKEENMEQKIKDNNKGIDIIEIRKEDTMVQEVNQNDSIDNEIKGDNKAAANREGKDENLRNKRELPCTYAGCNRIFHRPDRLKKHMLFHSNERQFTCAILSCGKSYITAQHLRRHHRIAHADSDTTIESSLGILCNVPCDEVTCTRTFQTKSSMSKHYEKIHLNARARYTCEECFTSFFYCAAYYKHLYEEHGIKMFMCDKCDLTFTCQTDKTRHMRGHRTWICEEVECQGLVFDKYNEKRRHDAVVHPTLYICHHCNFQGQRKYYLIEHMYSKHLPSWERPLLTCSYETCNKTFQHERNYVQHYKKKHLKEASLFICPLGCPQTFATKQSCQRHVTKIHQKVEDNEKEEPDLPFSCEYCSKKFGKQLNVRRHILRVHIDYPRPAISKLINSVYIPPGFVSTPQNSPNKFVPTPRSRLKKQKTSVVAPEAMSEVKIDHKTSTQ